MAEYPTGTPEDLQVGEPGWLTREVKRAKDRLAETPPQARPVVAGGYFVGLPSPLRAQPRPPERTIEDIFDKLGIPERDRDTYREAGARLAVHGLTPADVMHVCRAFAMGKLTSRDLERLATPVANGPECYVPGPKGAACTRLANHPGFHSEDNGAVTWPRETHEGGVPCRDREFSYACTRERGHLGEHVAHDLADQVVHRWW